jgi:hypothetical protein
MGEWRTRFAEAIVLYGGTGVMAQFIPGEDDDGNLVWRAAQESTSGGRPHRVVTGGETLTPQELLEALRGSLGVDAT